MKINNYIKLCIIIIFLLGCSKTSLDNISEYERIYIQQYIKQHNFTLLEITNLNNGYFEVVYYEIGNIQQAYSKTLFIPDKK